MIAKRIETNRARLDNPNKPIGVFMLCGPSGVGKTETALALAETLYGGEQNIITINMSEFQEAHTVSTLKGAPPGYVGYGEGGRLTEAVRRRPYSVVLLDEIEKAHPDVHELFFQVFDKGVMEDGTGRRIDFKNTLILLTSNVGTERSWQAGERPTPPEPEALAAELKPALLDVFPPALLGRIVTIPYYPLSDGGARRHRAAAARPHRQAHRGEPSGRVHRRRQRDRSYRFDVQRSRTSGGRVDRQYHHQHDPAGAFARDSQALAGARADHAGEGLGRGRTIRLRVDLTRRNGACPIDSNRSTTPSPTRSPSFSSSASTANGRRSSARNPRIPDDRRRLGRAEARAEGRAFDRGRNSQTSSSRDRRSWITMRSGRRNGAKLYRETEEDSGADNS